MPSPIATKRREIQHTPQIGEGTESEAAEATRRRTSTPKPLGGVPDFYHSSHPTRGEP